MSVRRFIVADPSLIDDKGHHLTTSIRLAEAAGKKGMLPVIAGNVKFQGTVACASVFPAFSDSIYAESAPKVRMAGADGNRSEPFLSRLAVDFQSMMEALRLGAEDVVFFHTATVNLVRGVVDLFTLGDPAGGPSLHFLLRYDPATDRWMGDPRALGTVLEGLHRRFGRPVCHLYAETEALADVYQAETGLPVAVMRHFPSIDPDRPRRAEGGPADPVRVAYLGEARIEKGFDALPAAVRVALGAAPRPFRFVCQTYASSRVEGTLTDAVAALRDDAPAGGYELHDTLSDDRYQELLLASDVVLVPHRAPQYARRGSGIFVDALCTGMVVVVRAGTWMASLAAAHGNIVVFDDDGALAGAIARAVELVGRPVERGEADRAFSVAHTIGQVLENHGAPPDAAPIPRRRALLVAPWWPKQGSTRVFQTQAAVLASCGFTVQVLSLVTFPVDKEVDAGLYEWFRAEMDYGDVAGHWIAFPNRALLPELEGCARALFEREDSWTAEMLRGLAVELPPSLEAFVREAGVDLVVCNYVHHLPVVRRLNLPAGVPVVVETHDIRSLQHSSRLGLPPLEGDLRAEITGAARADGLVFINEEERRVFEEGGASVPSITVLPTLPLRLERGWVETAKAAHGSANWSGLAAATAGLVERLAATGGGGTLLVAALRMVLTGCR